MKKLLWIGLGIGTFLNAQIISLTDEQKNDWQIKTQIAASSNSLPLGEFIAEVTTPPQNLHTLTLPFEAQVKKLYVASYENIKKGQLLAEVTGRDWIEIQQRFIADAIELKHHGHIAERKNRLCREEIIPKKECIDANAEHQADKIKVSASKALLRGYGATDQMIDDLFKKLKIAQSIQIRSDVDGKLLELNIQVGKSTLPSDALFIIQKEGALWLETQILAQKAMQLTEGQKVQLAFNNQTFESQLLLHSPIINPENQTQKVRFSLPTDRTFLSGLRNTATISIESKTLKVAKKSVINHGNKNIVFVQTAQGYAPMTVEIVGEESDFYYIQDSPKLQNPIVTTSTAILKSLMEGEDE
ncbi:efflux RND transporter periplasmic adaptor subunit [bacterium]|nr:efflux RND transporter periplasmic adaptor subunit [bacterium]MBU1958176.1 efflux RND transporter periplasmic adaptor subunit [bacterium]